MFWFKKKPITLEEYGKYIIVGTRPKQSDKYVSYAGVHSEYIPDPMTTCLWEAALIFHSKKLAQRTIDKLNSNKTTLELMCWTWHIREVDDEAVRLADSIGNGMQNALAVK